MRSQIAQPAKYWVHHRVFFMRRLVSIVMYVRVPRSLFCQRLCEKGKTVVVISRIDWSRLLPGEIPLFGYLETYQMTVETYENNGSPILSLLFF